jgi:hypothetical protein
VRRAAAAARAVALAAAALLAGGCASDATAITDQPLCGTGERDAGNGVVLMAQSVPTATWVPCIRTALPLGWSFHHLKAHDGGAEFSFDSDRDGQQAIEVRFRPACDTGSASEIPSDREGMRRLERVGRVSPAYIGNRYYLFEGGCLVFAFRLEGDNPGEALALASEAIGTVSRDDLRAQVRAETDGRLSLDPAASRDGGTP